MIYLVRHTTPLIPAGLCYGQSDVPLAPSYASELTVIRQKLPQHIDRCFSSPLTRCRQLAEDLFDGPVTSDDRLLELNFGKWEMRRWDELDQVAARHWGEHFVTTACPGGESFLDLQRRVLDFWQTAQTTTQTTLIVTHGGAIRVILAHLQRLPLEQAFTIPVEYGQVIALRANDF